MANTLSQSDSALADAQRALNELFKTLPDLDKLFPLPQGYALTVIILAAVHIVVSTGMLFLAARAAKGSFVMVSLLVWAVSLVVCIVIVVMGVLEEMHIKAVNHDVQNLGTDFAAFMNQAS